MKKRLVLMGLALFAVFGAVLAWNLEKREVRSLLLKYYERPPLTVSVATAKAETWQPTLTAVGSLTAIQGVNVTTQMAGKVSDILFNDGQKVQKGDLLVKLDDSLEQAELANSQAALNLSQIAIQRFRPLLKEGGISPFRMDKLQAKNKEAMAQMEEAQAKINYLNIKAPFTGRLGIRQIDLGEYIQAGQTLVRLDSQGTLYVDFNLPERNLSQVFVEQKITLATDSIPGKTFNGTIMAISPQVDESTRTFALRAMVPNEENELTPGTFADVHVQLKEEKNVVSVPKTAVSYTLYGDTIYTLKKDKGKKHKGKQIYVIKKVPITPGLVQGNKVAITKGLQAKIKVVTSGQLKLENGSKVVLKVGKVLTPPETIPLN